MDILQSLLFLGPVHCQHFFIPHFTQVALHIKRKQTFASKRLDDLQREIVCQQAAQMINTGIHILQTFNRERIGFRRHTLFPFVGILTIDILKTDRTGTGKHFHFDVLFPQIVHHRHLAIRQGSDKLESFRTQMFDGMCKIERCSPWHVHCLFRSNYFIQSNISNATKIVFHKISFPFSDYKSRQLLLFPVPAKL